MYNPEKLMPDPTDGGSVESKEKSKQKLPVLVESYFNGEIYKDDPAGFAMHLSSLEFESEEYEDIIPVLEKRCQEKIDLLGKYRISLRGDCINEEYIQDPPDSDYLGAVRNRFVEVETSKDKLKVRFELMIELLHRLDYAYVYDYSNQKDRVEATPCIMYGFRKFYKSDKKESEHGIGISKYFYGHVDDIGGDFNNINFIRLPKSTGFDGKQSKEKLRMFPYSNYLGLNPNYHTSQEDYARSNKIIKTIGEKNLHPQQFSTIEAQLTNVRSYFDVLLIIDKILFDIDEYDKNPTKSDEKSE